MGLLGEAITLGKRLAAFAKKDESLAALAADADLLQDHRIMADRAKVAGLVVELERASEVNNTVQFAKAAGELKILLEGVSAQAAKLAPIIHKMQPPGGSARTVFKEAVTATGR